MTGFKSWNFSYQLRQTFITWVLGSATHYFVNISEEKEKRMRFQELEFILLTKLFFSPKTALCNWQ